MEKRTVTVKLSDIVPDEVDLYGVDFKKLVHSFLSYDYRFDTANLLGAVRAMRVSSSNFEKVVGNFSFELDLEFFDSEKAKAALKLFDEGRLTLGGHGKVLQRSESMVTKFELRGVSLVSSESMRNRAINHPWRI